MVKDTSAEYILSIMQTIASVESLDEQLHLAMEEITRVVGAERGSLFLNDPQTNELYSRVALGNVRQEIRVLNSTGIAGRVFSQGQAMIVNDAYEHQHFNAAVDENNGFKTHNILSVPVVTVRGEIIGVAQVLNKIDGMFTEGDLQLVQEVCTQVAIVLQGTLYVERMDALREQEAEFLSIVSEVSAEINLTPLLQMIMEAVTKMLDAERSTLFINDEHKNEL